MHTTCRRAVGTVLALKQLDSALRQGSCAVLSDPLERLCLASGALLERWGVKHLDREVGFGAVDEVQ